MKRCPTPKVRASPQTQDNADEVAEAGSEAISAAGAGEATPAETTLSEAELTEPVQKPVAAATAAVIPLDGQRGVLFLIRLHGLEKINQTLGYRQANSFLRQIGDLVSKIAVTGAAKPPVTWPRA